MERTRAMALLAALAACDGGKDTTDPPVETDREEDTAREDTAPEDTPPQPRDTGLGIIITNEGRADVLGGAALLGHEVQVLRVWNPNTDARTKERCVWTWDATSWANAPERDGQADPLGAHLTECPGCAFAFTVSFARRARGPHLPWDTDVDTDAPLDTDGETRPVDCYTAALIDFEGLGIVLPEERWEGYGYDPASDADDDPNTGWLMLWDRMNRIWVPFVYDVTIEGGELSWAYDFWSYAY
ncbi:MAG TPA: hypothetical protein PKA64_07640 [Myxococcota bacterium]|nr:hypothetical protein [Myxococcota bacterium]